MAAAWRCAESFGTRSDSGVGASTVGNTALRGSEDSSLFTPCRSAGTKGSGLISLPCIGLSVKTPLRVSGAYTSDEPSAYSRMTSRLR